MINTSIDDKAYALGIIGREFQIDFNEKLSPDQLRQLDEIAEDVILPEPKTEIGIKLKAMIEEEKSKPTSDYNTGFDFSKDLNNNKIVPMTIFLLETLAKYAQRLVDKDKNVEGEILSELIIKMNELEYPIGTAPGSLPYFKSPFNTAFGYLQKQLERIEGQVTDREEEIKAYGIGARHPKFNTLSPHIASFKQMDEAIVKLRETFGFTEEDFRGKA